MALICRLDFRVARLAVAPSVDDVQRQLNQSLSRCLMLYTLQARIMAAQERAKQAQHPSAAAVPAAPKEEDAASAPPPYTEDLLMMENDEKPPEFDSMFLPPPPPVEQQSPPPMFDDTFLPPPETSASTTLLWDPHAPTPMTAPAPSAPAFEDLLDGPPKFVAPPPPSSQEQEALEAILGMEGLSDEEKQQLLEEQKRIMASIEANKSSHQVSAAAARADAFEQRSFSAAVQAASRSSSHPSSAPQRAVQIGKESVPLHGVEVTHRAMEEGTAITVQCLACDNWMRVTKEATLMFCPVCQTVSPVVVPEGGGPDGAVQVDSDLALAEKLQQEEYSKAERSEQRRAQARGTADAAAASPPKPAEAQGWMEWLGLSAPPTAAPANCPERPASFEQGPVQRGYMGVSLPPGSSSGAKSPPRAAASSGGLMAAQTETITFEEEDVVLEGRSSRAAEPRPLFSYVTDSITSAATSLYTTTLTEDEEGNIHGVDSSSLLAVPTIRREGGGDRK